MPLPLGHTAIGWAALETARPSQPTDTSHRLGSPMARFIFAVFLANLPDLDVLFGLLVQGNGAAFHRGPTHSLLFALLAGCIAAQMWRLSPRIPRFGYGLCFLLILSHVAADMLLTNAPVSLMWPFEIYFSPGHSGWGQVMHTVLFRGIQDAGIVIVCMAYVLALRLVKRRIPVFNRPALAKRRIK